LPLVAVGVRQLAGGDSLGAVLGAAIATVTPVLVVNVELEPAWLVWRAATMIETPTTALAGTGLRCVSPLGR
jgi:hypothetical protein